MIKLENRPRPLKRRRLLEPSDFTYLGAYRIPRDVLSGKETVFGNGLALRRETADTTNNVHLLSAAFGGSINHEVFEWRDATPTISGTTLSNYNLATVMKEYGDVYSSKKKIIYDGVDTPLTNQLDGDLGLYWDDTDSRLYWSYGFGYSTGNPADADSWCMGYSTLNYGAGTGTGFGPWKFYGSGSGQMWKALMAGLVGVPSGYAASYLSGKRLAVGMGGYYSIIGSHDCSLGPSLTAFDPSALPAAEGKVTSTPLVGYWPHSGDPGAGKGRCNRPENATALGVDSNWGLGKFSWNDRVRGGVWIDTGKLYGTVFFGSFGRNRTQYLSSQIPSSFHGHYWAIYDPYQFTPASGTARYDLQPVNIYRYEYPTIDYTQMMYAQGTSKSVSSITSTAVVQSTPDGAIVNCTGHGLINGDWIEIFGSSLSEYNELWAIPNRPEAARSDGATSGAGSTTLTSALSSWDANSVGMYVQITAGTNFVNGYYKITGFTNPNTVTLASSPTPSGAGSGGTFVTGGVFSANAFHIYNTSSGANWSGNSPSGTITLKQVDNSVDRVLGAAYDAISKKLYVAVSVEQGVNGLNSHVMIHVYQLS